MMNFSMISPLLFFHFRRFKSFISVNNERTNETGRSPSQGVLPSVEKRGSETSRTDGLGSAKPVKSQAKKGKEKHNGHKK
jgi:hypothetical protein